MHALYAQTALANIRREYPNHLTRLVLDETDANHNEPHAHHPIFYGSYDWHSCVHMHWSLARLLNLNPTAGFASEIVALFNEQFTHAKAAQEALYFERTGARSWQRPYGWGWLLKLYAELALCTHPEARAWRMGLTPLVNQIADQVFDYLKTAPHPVRHGVHSNTAFAMIHTLRYASTVGDYEFMDLLQAKARAWFMPDRDYRLAFDFSGEDFLSPALTEALLLSIVLPQSEFTPWFDAYLPELMVGDFRHLQPAVVVNETDARQVHNHGLNLSRAWCMQGIAQALPLGHTAAVAFGPLAKAHSQSAQAAITGGDYVSTHWLVSFALLAETEWQH
jgi:Protein of unknown function (DUF2891)